MKHRSWRTAVTATAVMLIAGGCSYRVFFWERNIWQDTHGIFALVEPADSELYRKMLPPQFAVPDQPMVGIYLVHFVDTEPWPITLTEYLLPYHEATILLRCVHDGRTGWYSHVMPVSTTAAMIGGRRMGFPKYVADEIRLERTTGGWLGSVTHEGETKISMRFNNRPVDQLGPLTTVQKEFVSGDGDAANLRGPIILLKPPGEGPEVNVLPCSPPPLAERQAGTVEIELVAPYDGLVPAGTVAPGLYQRFTLTESGPPWSIATLFVVVMIGTTSWLARRVMSRRRNRTGRSSTD